MSGRVSRRRQRKVKREMAKDEIRCCVNVFEEFIYSSSEKTRFIDREYKRPTWNHTPNKMKIR
ncbi:MAG: hypothetical protein P1Q69_17495 [Candidatus Thorarchaeota archaeon]|nr:hypothetical protein [Candidatus Thorarchaeota archaeon]